MNYAYVNTTLSMKLFIFRALKTTFRPCLLISSLIACLHISKAPEFTILKIN